MAFSLRFDSIFPQVPQETEARHQSRTGKDHGSQKVLAKTKLERCRVRSGNQIVYCASWPNIAKVTDLRDMIWLSGVLPEKWPDKSISPARQDDLTSSTGFIKRLLHLDETIRSAFSHEYPEYAHSTSYYSQISHKSEKIETSPLVLGIVTEWSCSRIQSCFSHPWISWRTVSRNAPDTLVKKNQSDSFV
jgi:hypothetical protein